MKYLKVFTDFIVDMQELGDAECGRLFKAMLLYAETGKEDQLRGNERFVWGTAKKNIDAQRISYERRLIVNKANGSEPKRTEAKASDSLQEQEQEQEQEHKKKNTKKKKNNPALKYEQTPISAQDFDALVVDFSKEDQQ